jgi:signal transduction histidine kinase
MSNQNLYVDDRPRTGLLKSVLMSPLWALPFALFFGTMFGANWPAYRIAMEMALVFTVTIRVALWLAGRWLIPALRIRRADSAWVPITLVYVGSAIAGSYVSAFFIARFIQHDFATEPRGWLLVGLWALLFTALFSGIILAQRFHQAAIERAAQVERIRAELIRAELRALQAQVNPHFLFNTLNSIAALIGENPVAAEDLTTRLADVFRYALTASRREHVRLADELEFIRTCLSIEHVRFGARLRVREDIEPGLDDVPVPALLLQPLVENAVRYAVSPREEGGEVRLSVRREGASLVVTVADDGPGFTPGAAPRGHGVGLESVRERLRLAGTGHALDVRTAPGAGTTVTVTLPLEPVTHAVAPEPEGRDKECV